MKINKIKAHPADMIYYDKRGSMFPSNIKILIADDMLTMRKLVAKTLKDLGFTDIIEATDGAKAWEAFSASNPTVNLIISDWNMPNCTGLDFLKRVRADGRFKNTPFILLTAESDQAQVMEAIKAGVDCYIVKPFTKDQVEAKLKEVAAKKKVA